MRFSVKLCALAVAAIVFTGVTLANKTAYAVAAYVGSAEATLTIDAIRNLTDTGDSTFTDLLITGTASIFDSDALFSGNAFSAFAGSASVIGADADDLGVGDGLSQSSSVSGFASLPLGFAESFFLTDGFIDLFNFSTTDAFEVDFSVSFVLSADATAGIPANEFAAVIATVEIDSPDFLETIDVIADSDFGADPAIDDGFGFTVTLAPDSSDFVGLIVESGGIAVAIPEPWTLPMFVLGLAVLGFVARRGGHGMAS